MSSLIVDTLTNQEPQIAQAWVNFDGTGTVSINDSFNVTSITDNGTGSYTMNLTTALADTNYFLIGMGSLTGTAANTVYEAGARTTSAARVDITRTDTNAAFDADIVSMAILGGNA